MDKVKLAAQLALDEGKRSKPYADTVGEITIGVGHNLTDRGLSDPIITRILGEDIDIACNDLDSIFPEWKMLSEPRQQVLANMMFNLGVLRFSGFKGTLAAIRAGKFDTAADEMLNSKWAQQVGQRAQRLAREMRQG